MGKDKTEDVLSFGIVDLKRKGFLVGLKTGSLSWTIGMQNHKIGVAVFMSESSSFIRLYYSQIDQEGVTTKLDYEISITKSKCNYGGFRYWFLCNCGKRVGKLFSGGGYFVCRHCHDLTYKTRNINRRHAAYPLLRANQLVKRMNVLQTKIKTPYYAKKSTRKQKQLDKICRELTAINRLL